MSHVSRTLCFVLGIAILVPATFLVPADAQELESRDFEARRRELRERYKKATTPAEKRAILDEFRKLELEERGESSFPARDRVPTAEEVANLGAPLSLSNALALGSTLATDGELSDKDAKMLIAMAGKGGVTDGEKKDLAELREVYGDTLSEDAKKRLDEILAEGDSTKYTLNTDNKTWTSTYFPMAGSGVDDAGSPEKNLWAKDGALAKADKVFEARNGRPGTNLERERKSAVGWLMGEDKGFFIPSSTLRESDAERTTGIDFNGNGTIDPDVKVDFLDSRGNFTGPKTNADGSIVRDDKGVPVFEGDGKTEGSMGVGWWGRCNNVGVAGTIFKEPKRSVTVKGPNGEDVTFSPTEIKGLLAVYSDTIVDKGTEFVGNRFDDQPAILVLEDGTTLRGDIENAGELDFLGEDMWRAGNPALRDFMVLDTKALEKRDKKIRFRDMNGEVKEYDPKDVKFLGKEDKDQDTEASVFHDTVMDWLGDGRGGVLEMDPGSHVWNYNFESAEVVETKTRPFWAPAESKDLKGFNGPAGKGEVTYFETKVRYNGGGGNQTYHYWVEKDDKGNVVNSGWVGKNPDFMWRATETKIDWTQPVPDLPDLDPELIRELYEKSTADEPVSNPTGTGTGTGEGN